jgi:large subunit ribosomal protein L20
MTRVKRGVTASKRRKNLLKNTKGYILGRSKKFREAKQAFLKAGSYAYRDRNVKKRAFRRLWITRINIACREKDLTYRKFINLLNLKKIELDRKLLAELAINHPLVFDKIITEVKK